MTQRVKRTLLLAGLSAGLFAAGCDDPEPKSAAQPAGESQGGARADKRGSMDATQAAGSQAIVESTDLRLDVRKAIQKRDLKKAQEVLAELMPYRARVPKVYQDEIDACQKLVEDAAAGKWPPAEPD